jgi:4-hydroxybenzoate polyprenyltransferase
LHTPCNPQAFTGARRLKLFWALSRTPHGLIDMTTPCFAALLWLGTYPSLAVTAIGLLTVFAGYTAVYALNDLIGFRSDRAKIEAGGFGGAAHACDLDALLIRHPLAQGLLTLREGLCWTFGWALVAMLGAYHLNPACLLIFAGGCLLETVYCLLWRVSPYRALVSGAVKATGALAAVVAVDPRPSPLFLLALFLMLFCWEIGGQNAPNDWTDLQEDRRFGARTLPVVFGLPRTRDIILAALFLTMLFTQLSFLLSQASLGLPTLALTAAVGLWLLLGPAWRLHTTGAATDAMQLFNRASYYPLALLVLVALRLLV